MNAQMKNFEAIGYWYGLFWMAQKHPKTLISIVGLLSRSAINLFFLPTNCNRPEAAKICSRIKYDGSVGKRKQDFLFTPTGLMSTKPSL